MLQILEVNGFNFECIEHSKVGWQCFCQLFTMVINDSGRKAAWFDNVLLAVTVLKFFNVVSLLVHCQLITVVIFN